MPYIEDAFGATAGTDLTDGGYSPTGISGGFGTVTWTAVGGNSFVTSNSGRARGKNSAQNRVVTNSFSPSSEAWYVECDLHVVSIESNGLGVSVYSHCDTLPNGYELRLEALSGDLVVKLFRQAGSNAIGTNVTGAGFSAGVTNTAWVQCTTGCPVSTTTHQTIDIYLYDRIWLFK